MRARAAIVSAVSLGLCATLSLSHAAASAAAPASPSSPFTSVADIVGAEIAAGHVPGAVILVGGPDGVLYRQAFGLRATNPDVPMTIDTIFDLASLTKVVATTTAVMQLAESGRIDLDAPAARYWQAFGAGGKERITVRDLLTHYSGLRADLDTERRWAGYETAMSMLIAERPLSRPGSRYVYSDENFEVLGEIVRRVSGMPLDRYCEQHIFEPLGMFDTHFRPAADQSPRIAPTSARQPARGVFVNDPTAQRMGGVAGHAGLFSTADDLSQFAMMLLNGGAGSTAAVLSARSVASMTQPASPAGGAHPRGLGWDFVPPAATDSARPDDVPAGSYGHTGYTGTMIWLDPLSKTYVIILTNRTYRSGGDAQPLRTAILGRVFSTLAPQAVHLQ